MHRVDPPPGSQESATVLATSTLAPVALGFFGLGVTYLVWGPQEAFGLPARDASVDRASGMWGIFMGGLCQAVTG